MRLVETHGLENVFLTGFKKRRLGNDDVWDVW